MCASESSLAGWRRAFSRGQKVVVEGDVAVLGQVVGPLATGAVVVVVGGGGCVHHGNGGLWGKNTSLLSSFQFHHFHINRSSVIIHQCHPFLAGLRTL